MCNIYLLHIIYNNIITIIHYYFTTTIMICIDISIIYTEIITQQYYHNPNPMIKTQSSIVQ